MDSLHSFGSLLDMSLSVVIPAYNEADNIAATIGEISGHLTRLGATFEILVMDDHSSDGTFDAVRALNDPQVRAIRLSRNSGSHIALRAGLRQARGDAVLCISADGQDNPEAIEAMIARWEGGADVVWALRTDRNDEALLNKTMARAFYLLLTAAGAAPTDGVDLSKADFFLMDRRVADAVNACPERNSSLFGLLAWAGFRQEAISYHRRLRASGHSKWSFQAKVRLAKDWVFAFSGLPLQMMTRVGVGMATLGLLYAAVVIAVTLITGEMVPGFPSLMTTVLVLGGVQMIMLGLLGEYVWRTLDESRKRPSYFVEADSAHPPAHSRARGAPFPSQIS
ncbi:glycosyltransferase family 2 protein [Magnetofaba australis]|uniref:Putative glycosyltransferase n=1 Tax=Magnetofaba australis IT-1 TaxID=1434232 RepID=A0A1Y2K2S5_9PROT|nr:glycosyltransferase family 2 protein [Magnetofaba australis]OSM02249.1 putative glycosyltransferase [Magnetofaba australis IT-1]